MVHAHLQDSCERLQAPPFDRLKDLQKLIIKNIPMSTSLPESLCSCVKLATLVIQGTGNLGLHGPIPSCVASLSALKLLQLPRNRLNGSVPSLPLAALTEVDLSDNELTGSLPDMKGQFLSQVLVEGNHLSSIGNLSDWKSLQTFKAPRNLITQTLADILPPKPQVENCTQAKQHCQNPWVRFVRKNCPKSSKTRPLPAPAARSLPRLRWW